MEKLEKQGKTELYNIFKKMCDEVNAPLTAINNGEKWFQKYQWSELEQEVFTAWLADYLYKDKNARIQMMERPIKNKIQCRKVADMFVMNYRWMVKDQSI